MTAFRGSTTSGQPLQSAYQMTAAFEYSITGVFGTFFDQINNDLGNIDTGPTGQGVDGGAGSISASPQPLPSGEVTDADLAAAQSGTLMPPPPVIESPSPEPEPVPEPVVEPVVVPEVTAPVDTAPVVLPTDASVYDPSAGVTPPATPTGDYSDTDGATDYTPTDTGGTEPDYVYQDPNAV